MGYSRSDWLRCFCKWKAEDDSIREWGRSYVARERRLLCSEGAASGDIERAKPEPNDAELARFFPSSRR